MSNPKLATVPCPTCGQTATVHREKQGKRALYIRCYGGDGGGEWCGTLQCRGPAGQRYIERHAQWLDMSGQDEAKQEAAEEAGEAAAEEIRSERKKRRSPLARITEALTTDEE